MALTQVTPDVLHNIQSNVTQVGTLSNLTVTGNILSGNVIATNFTGTASLANNASYLGGTSAASYALTSTVIGLNQSWQDVIGSRSAGVTYTNSTGKSIMVGIRTQGPAYITVGGVITAYSGINNASNFLGTIVPNGASYYMTGAVYNWAELR
jgi:hypothetical protein